MTILDTKIRVSFNSHGGVTFHIPKTPKTEPFNISNTWGGQWGVTFACNVPPTKYFNSIIDAYWATMFFGEQVTRDQIMETGLVTESAISGKTYEHSNQCWVYYKNKFIELERTDPELKMYGAGEVSRGPEVHYKGQTVDYAVTLSGCVDQVNRGSLRLITLRKKEIEELEANLVKATECNIQFLESKNTWGAPA